MPACYERDLAPESSQLGNLHDFRGLPKGVSGLRVVGLYRGSAIPIVADSRLRMVSRSRGVSSGLRHPLLPMKWTSVGPLGARWHYSSAAQSAPGNDDADQAMIAAASTDRRRISRVLEREQAEGRALARWGARDSVQFCLRGDCVPAVDSQTAQDEVVLLMRRCLPGWWPTEDEATLF